MNAPVLKKEFGRWMHVKENVHNYAPQRSFHEGEIWWMAAGENVGVEINGKGELFARPAVVFKKLNKRSCFIIPLTSQEHNGTWYVRFDFGQRTEYAVLAQMRVVDARRLYRRMGRLSKADYQKVADGMKKLLFPELE